MGWTNQPITAIFPVIRRETAETEKTMRNESDRDRVIRLGRQALKNLDKDKNWTWWIDVGNAILIGREECKAECGLADTNLPPGSWGGAYARAFGDWLKR